MPGLITGAFFYLRQGASKIWNWLVPPEEDLQDAAQRPSSQRSEGDDVNRKRSKTRRKKKTEKRVPVKKRGEAPSSPPSADSRQEDQSSHDRNSSQSKGLPTGRTSKIQSEKTSATDQNHLSKTQNHVGNAAFRVGKSYSSFGYHVNNDTDDDDGDDDEEEGENVEQLDPSEESEEEYDYMRRRESYSDQNAGPFSDGDGEKHQSWFEKSENASAQNRNLDDSEEIKLSEKQAQKFKSEGNGRRVYPNLAEDSQNLLESDPAKYKRCQIRIETSHRSIARVLDKCDKYSEILIDGRSKAGRTYMNDEVVVQILSEPKRNRHIKNQTRKAWSSRDEGNHSMEEIPHGRVVGILKRTKFANVDYPVVYCKLDRTDGFLMRPLCKTVPKVHVINDKVKKEDQHLTKTLIEIKQITRKGDLAHKDVFDVPHSKRQQCVFKVVMLGWKASCHYPLGAVLDVYVYGNDYSSELDILTMQLNVPKLFPEDVVKETRNLSEENILTQKEGREDLTDERVFTIDGPDSKDLDDAISIKKERSHYIVGVHISDVASVIKKESSIDLEARRRAVTFYPLHRQPHPMLPEPICHGLCSLLPGQERLALSVFFRFDGDKNQVKEPPVIKKSVIKSCQQLTYEQVQAVINRDPHAGIEPPLQTDITILHEIATGLRKTRKRESTLFVPFADPRMPDVDKATRDRKAHALIEEFMILTNSAVAFTVSKNKSLKDVMLVRCQKAPTVEQRCEWREREGDVANLVMQLQGKRVSPETYLSFNVTPSRRPQRNVLIQRSVWLKICQNLERREKEEARELACMDDLHPMQFLANKHWTDLMEMAEYKCYHGLNRPEIIHFDLDRGVYTNCTSPIRRYADLQVQRVLHAHLDKECVTFTPEVVTELCQHINVAVLSQKMLESGCRHLVLLESLRDQPLVFRAYVERVDKEQLTICVPSLRQLSDWKRALPFSVFGISCQPDLITDTALQQDTVTVQWDKRMFQNATTLPVDAPGHQNSHRADGRNSVTSIHPEQLCVSVKSEKWSRIVKSLSSVDEENLMSVLPNTEKKVPSGMISVPFNDSNVPCQQPIHFQATYTPGQVLQIQMSAEVMSGTMQLRVDTLRVARNVELCLQHAQQSVPTLCPEAKHDIQSLDFSMCKSRKTARTKYLKTMIPLIEMEAAVGAGHNQETVVIENVFVTMEELASHENRKYTGSFSLSSKFCSDQGIEIGGKSTDSFGQKQPKANGGKFALDFLCLRYKTNCSPSVQSQIQQSAVSVAVEKDYTWLAHGWVAEVVHRKHKAADGDQLVVTFHLSPTSRRPPDLLMTKGASLTIELLPKLDVHRVAQEMLCRLKDRCHSLPRAMALGLELPVLDADYKEAVLSVCPSDVEVTGADGTRPLPRNNPSQKEAIDKALTSTLTLVRGPPGTGKTNTGIKLVSHFCEVNRHLQVEGWGQRTVLYCGPSNKSVDLVARELQAKLGAKCPRIVRVYGAFIENQDYPVPGRQRTSAQEGRNQQSDPTLRNISLHHMIRQRGKPYAEQLQGYDERFRRCLSHPSLYPVDHQDVKNYLKLLFKACKEELQHHECILTTCAVGASFKLVEYTAGSKEEKSSVFQIIIDECGMCTEADTLAPIIATRARQVVLIGDHQQLRPIVTCQRAAELGLNRSLFERLHQTHPDTSVLLREQYRMHPEICAFPSTEFYGGELRTQAPGKGSQSQTWNVDPLPFWPRRFPQLHFPGSDYEKQLQAASQAVPHLLVNVQGLESVLTVTTEEGNERSRSNALEADKVMEILAYLKKVHKVNLKRVKVLTQYKVQRHLLEKRVRKACQSRLNDAFDTGDKIKLLQEAQLIGTVVSSQGDEWDYVIISTVRSLPPYKIEATPSWGWCLQNLGFITDRNQINVALTRARRGLIIVGNVDLLKCDEVWSRLVERYETLGCLYQADQFPPR